MSYSRLGRLTTGLRTQSKGTIIMIQTNQEVLRVIQRLADGMGKLAQWRLQMSELYFPILEQEGEQMIKFKMPSFDFV